LAPAGNINAALLRLLSNKDFHAAVFYVVGNNNELNSTITAQLYFSQIVGSSLDENGRLAVEVPDTSIMLFAMVLKSQSELGTVAIQFTALVTTRC
jgi:predicted MPP superfamily phosphohydrolase